MLSNDLLNGANEAAAYVGCNRRLIYGLVENGEIPCIRKGRKLFFRKSELDRAFSSEAA